MRKKVDAAIIISILKLEYSFSMQTTTSFHKKSKTNAILLRQHLIRINASKGQAMSCLVGYVFKRHVISEPPKDTNIMSPRHVIYKS
jgi:hypothetical protein